MVDLIIEKQCACLKKSSYSIRESFDSKKKAINKAKIICEDINKNLCLKHKFHYEENQDNIIIKMEINK